MDAVFGVGFSAGRRELHASDAGTAVALLDRRRFLDESLFFFLPHIVGWMSEHGTSRPAKKKKLDPLQLSTSSILSDHLNMLTAQTSTVVSSLNITRHYGLKYQTTREQIRSSHRAQKFRSHEQDRQIAQELGVSEGRSGGLTRKHSKWSSSAVRMACRLLSTSVRVAAARAESPRPRP